jgi:hypothetical protein
MAGQSSCTSRPSHSLVPAFIISYFVFYTHSVSRKLLVQSSSETSSPKSLSFVEGSPCFMVLSLFGLAILAPCSSDLLDHVWVYPSCIVCHIHPLKLLFNPSFPFSNIAQPYSRQTPQAPLTFPFPFPFNPVPVLSTGVINAICRSRPGFAGIAMTFANASADAS